MNTSHKNLSFLTNGFIPIIENNGIAMPYTLDVLLKTVQTFAQAGVMEVEMADRKEGALEVFAEVYKMLRADESKNPIPKIGPGTIQDPWRAQQYIDAGAEFIVAAFFVSSVADVCCKNNVPYIPGVYTPTEAHHATSHSGVSVLKIFPSHTPRHVKALKLVLPTIPMVASWGPAMETLQEWIAPGYAESVVFGSSLVDIGLQDKDFSKLQSTIENLIRITQKARGQGLHE